MKTKDIGGSCLGLQRGEGNSHGDGKANVCWAMQRQWDTEWTLDPAEFPPPYYDY